ncbi:MAG: cobalamin-dependent protein [Deltaproteobacteria bacterium]|nr:cobalamin-dependent protein [Deltaproteobacteria bacterium]MBW2137416.1 cobalamin-dependent protein [Deltaproteobacteria bacterium]
MAISPQILFINPRPFTWYTSAFKSFLTCPPLGILYLAAYLRRSGFGVDVIDLVADRRSKEEVADFLDIHRPPIVGITCTTEGVNAALRMCQFVKEHSPQSFTILGGAHPTFDYKAMLANAHVDFVIRYEGDIAMERFAGEVLAGEKPDFERINGLCWKNKAEIVVNEGQPFIQDLNQLPYPARDLIDLSVYSWPGAILASRGCPFKCVFCSAGALSGGQYRYRSAENVFAEIEHMVRDLGVRDFLFVDDTFTANRKRATKICEMIIDSPLDITFSCESRVNVVDPDFLALLKEAGCRLIQYGIESGSDEILKRIRKGITIRQVTDAVKWTHEQGIHIKGSFIIGHLWDTKETISRTFDFMRELQEEYGVEAYPALNIPFPGTEQYEKREELGLKILTDNWDEYNLGNAIIDTPNLSHIELRNFYFEIGQYALDTNSLMREHRMTGA